MESKRAAAQYVTWPFPSSDGTKINALLITFSPCEAQKPPEIPDTVPAYRTGSFFIDRGGRTAQTVPRTMLLSDIEKNGAFV